MAKNSKHSPKSKLKAAAKTNAKLAASTAPDSLNDDATKSKTTKNKRFFGLDKQSKRSAPKLVPGRTLVKRTLILLWLNKKSLGGVLLVYGIVQLLLVRGLVASDFTTVSDLVRENLSSGWAEFAGSIALLAYLVGAGGQGIPAEGSVYLLLLSIIASLALIWASRHIFAERTFRIRDAYYRGMYPLIPFILLLILALIQFIPLMFGSWLYQILIITGIAATPIEQLFWLIIILLLVILSLYMLMNTVIALYVVTLPDMEPIKALRSAKGLVQHRRLQIFWRVLFLIIVMTVIMACILVPIIMILPSLAPWLFYILSVLSLALIHLYMYGLYRELLRES